MPGSGVTTAFIPEGIVLRLLAADSVMQAPSSGRELCRTFESARGGASELGATVLSRYSITRRWRGIAVYRCIRGGAGASRWRGIAWLTHFPSVWGDAL